jgi:hypothetical protein
MVIARKAAGVLLGGAEVIGEALGGVLGPPLLLPQPAMRPRLATAATATPPA